MKANVNRYLWMLIFFAGIALSILMEWLATTTSPMVWFLLTGVWSAVCGIGFTVTNTLVNSPLTHKANRD